MKDIAQKIGVDRSTVSLALKNDPRISRATKDKVLATADELGYRPDPAFKILGAQRWKSRKTATGFVMAFIASKTQLDDPIAQRYLEGFRSEAHKLGFGFSEFNISEYDSIMKANQVLIHRGVSGLVFFRPPQEKDLYGYDWDQFASICLGYGS
ncbi:MAG: LacI family DNA-binding transcriptional regulator, partial [Verrucomicrobiota bacterium]